LSIVSTNWLSENLEKVKIIDCSWHLMSEMRDGNEEFLKEHIPGSIFFDLDKFSNQNSDLPHMLPSEVEWEKIISNLGITNSDRIIIYDNSDVLSACRCWYNFIYFGHDQNLVSVLDGGLKKWKLENKSLTIKYSKPIKSRYQAREKKELVKNIDQINDNIKDNNFLLIDARSKARFDGKEPDPRKNVRSGNIPGSKCLPFKLLINDNNTFKNKDELKDIFYDNLGENSNKYVFSCGSGVTACVLALAYSMVNNKYDPVIYDGSWAEYGKI